MSQSPYATGGVISGPDETPIYTQTMLALSRCDGYVIPARHMQKLGTPALLKILNERP